jgi:DNA-binding PadR family transcriptional regulator
MALSHAIMTALLEENLSGYDLAKKFDMSLGFFWQASHQQIYQELKKMLERGWLSSDTVEQAGKPNKILYALTGNGKSALDDWVVAQTKARSAKEDLYVKLYNIGHCDPEPLIGEIADRQLQCQRQLALYLKIKERHYAEPETLPINRKGIYLALSAGIRQQQMHIDWCDEALELLGALA